MTAADQFWAATEPAAPERTTVTHQYRFDEDELAARLGIPVPEGARIKEVRWLNRDGAIKASVWITVENKLERKP